MDALRFLACLVLRHFCSIILFRLLKKRRRRNDDEPSARTGQQSSAWLKGSDMLGQHWLGLHENNEGHCRVRSAPQDEGPTRYFTNVGWGASHCRMALQAPGVSEASSTWHQNINRLSTPTSDTATDIIKCPVDPTAPKNMAK